MDKTTAKAIKRLDNRFLLVGGWLRRRAAEALAGTGESRAVEPLIACLKDKNRKVAEAARYALLNLRSEAKDRLCALWSEKRDKRLEAILVHAGYIASSPLDLKYLTCLKQDRLEVPSKAGKEGVSVLLRMTGDRDGTISQNAKKVLLSLTNQDGINRLCALWSEKRDERLEAILVHAGYIASSPLELKSLTAFKTGKRPKENIPWQAIQSCLVDRDRDVVSRAVDYAMTSAGKTAEALWAFVLDHPESFVACALHEKGWRPQEATERALFYFLAGEEDLYHDIDFEQTYLRYWYESGNPALREAIASRIRKSGDTRLLAVFKTVRGARKESITEKEAEIQAEIMMKNRDYGGLFRLLPFCGHELGERIIRYLKEAGWQDPDPHGRELQERLDGILSGKREKGLPPSHATAIYEDFRPMFMGDERPPSTDDELRAWLEDDQFRRRSAALITLAERGSGLLKDAANKACGDDWWQVRMAAAACEVLRPGTLSSANRALLEQDHVVWVAALLKMPRGRRLAELGPEGLEDLRKMPSGRLPDPDHRPGGPDDFFEILSGLVPTAEREYLLTLGEFLGTDIVVSHETAYEAGATDVEIEMED